MCMIGRKVQLIRVPKSRPIIAYRFWNGYNAVKKGYHSSYIGDFIWPSNKQIRARSGAPKLRGVAGLHAFKTAKIRAPHVSTGENIGRVKLWGVIIEHEFGYRAEYGQIIPGIRKAPERRLFA